MADNTIRYVTVAAGGAVELASAPAPEPAPGELRVASRLVGICGSDVHAAAGVHPFIDLPYRPGHEAVGTVTALGDGVRGVAVGDRVVIEPNLVCGQCRQCRSGRYNICRELRVLGCQTPGALADAFTIPADRVHPVPESVSDTEAVLVEPLATPMHAVRMAGELSGANVVVLGAGTIGLLTALAARHAGAAAVLSTDLRADKRALAGRFGAAHTLPADEPDLTGSVARLLGDVDVVFDCVSTSGSISQAISIVDKGGAVLVVGVPAGALSVPLDLVQDREISVHGSLMYTSADMLAAMELLGSGAVPTEDLVSVVFGLHEAAEAFRAASSGAHTKVLVAVHTDAETY